jgi:hypothetical protein
MPNISYTYDGTPYTLYSRSDFNDTQAGDVLEQYLTTGKQSFDPANEKSIMVQPGQVRSISDAATHLRSIYDQYIAAPVSHATDVVQSNPTVQALVGPGFTAPIGQVSTSPTGSRDVQFQPTGPEGAKALGDYVKGTINDPIATTLMLGGGPLGKATGTIMQQLAPQVLKGTLKALGLPLGLSTATVGLDQLFNPDTPFTESMQKALTVGGVTSALQYTMAGWNKMLNTQASQSRVQQDMLAKQTDYNQLLEGFNETWSKYGLGDIEKNPTGFLKDMSTVAQEVGQKGLNTSISKIVDYVRLNAGDDVKKDFTSAIQSLRTNFTKLSGLEEGSTKYNEVFKDILDNLHSTQNIVYGIRGKGYGITNPSDTVLSYQLSQDPEFVKALVSSKALTQGQAGSIVKNKGLEQLLPDWKEYVTQRDIDRVVGRSNASSASMANARNVQAQQDLNLPLWQENIQNIVQEMNNINRSKAVTEAVINVGNLQDTEAVKKAAVEALQKFDKIDQVSQQLVSAASGRGQRLAHDLQGRTLADIQQYGSKDYRSLSGLQMSTVGPFNSTVLKSLKEHE